MEKKYIGVGISNVVSRQVGAGYLLNFVLHPHKTGVQGILVV